ncbi:MAG: response regulator [Magnetococcales bacterium]|nr:response regulator [Magnetococcales bacterium]
MNRLFWLAVAAWTALAGASLAWNGYHSRHQTRELVIQVARTSFMKDQAFRHWGASHGGVYVPADARTPPNPSLAHLPERDLQTPSGRRLTLMNPAYMVRQLMAEYPGLYGTRGRITSLKPLNPDNAPDPWERQALEAFERDRLEEAIAFTDKDGEPVLRLMRPMLTTEPCLKCHAHQDYRVGQVRGGVGVMVPLAPYLDIERNAFRPVAYSHGLFWGLGLVVAGFLSHRRTQRLAERQQAQAALDQARNELQKEKDQLQAILDNTQALVSLKDTAGRYLLVNRRFEDVLGPGGEAILGKTDREVFPAAVAAIFQADDQAVLELGRPVTVEQAIPREGASQTFVSVKFPLLDESGGPKAVGSIATDITERIQLEQALRAAMETAEAANRSKSTFLANMSHEIRTPLNAILGLTNLALRTDLSSKVRDYLVKVVSSSTTLLGIVNDILDLSKIDANKLELAPREFRIREIVDSLIDLFRTPIPEKKLELIIEISEAYNYLLVGDVLRLRQILTNLVGNAIKFTDQGEVEVGIEPIEQSGDRVTLEFWVRDTGSGIPPEEIPRLFHSFEQVKEILTDTNRGTGLGLAISQRLVDMMGGRIQVDSRPGEGSTFRFTLALPFRRQAVEQELAAPGDLSQVKALVVEDNAASLHAMLSFLRVLNLKGAGVSSGREALEVVRGAMAAGEPFRLVLVDWLMPDMDGEETARQLVQAVRQQGSGKPPPKIIQMVPFGLEEAIVSRVRQAGADGFIAKPITLSLLFDGIMEVFGREMTKAHRSLQGPVDLPRVAYTIGGARILLVEDNPINRQVAVELLEDVGLDVETADNGAMAVTMAVRTRYDLILMDIQMPEMDGLTATRTIRARENGPRVPIIAMTAHAMETHRDRSLAAGMDDHLAKPIDRQSLYGALMRWIVPRPGIGRSSDHPAGIAPEEDPLVLPPVLPGFDLSELRERFDNRNGLLHSLLDQLQTGYADAAMRLRTLLASTGDQARQAAHLLAHSVKGLGGNLAAPRLYAAAAHLEDRLEAAGPVREQSALLDEFENALDEVMAAIATLRPAGDACSPVVSPRADTAPPTALLQELATHLRGQNYKARITFNTLRARLRDPALAEPLERLKQCLDRYDFKGAEQALAALAELLQVPLIPLSDP